MRNGFLYIKVNGVPLDEVLKEISVKARVNIRIVGGLRDKVTLKDDSDWVRASAADALAMMKNRAVLSYLIEASE